ncbi:MAG: hypothetical protein M3Y06_06070, partial [Actinomycetota bacterium]|nr:hypothetical protein [Actinomycetota bacterium]
VGDDWRIAAGVIIALGATAVLAATPVPAWWLLPIAVVALLGVSLWRATRAGGEPATDATVMISGADGVNGARSPLP